MQRVLSVRWMWQRITLALGTYTAGAGGTKVHIYH